MPCDSQTNTLSQLQSAYLEFKLGELQRQLEQLILISQL
uniref:Uncharacterized protein n=1 Tax=Anguilla anguilla TaxID=7936 RepID=A0A0E9VIY0_ANGAN